jgi:hypothetical protein
LTWLRKHLPEEPYGNGYKEEGLVADTPGELIADSYAVRLLFLPVSDTTNKVARFNSAVFSSVTSSKYEMAVIPTDFGPDEHLVDGRDAEKFRSVTGFDADEIRNDILSGSLRNISLTECAMLSGVPVGTEIGLLLVVTDRQYSYERSGWLDRINASDSEAWDYQYTGAMWTSQIMKTLNDEYYVNPEHWQYPAWSFRNTTGPSTNDSSDEWQDYGDLYKGPKYSNDKAILSNYILIHNPDEPELRNILDTSSIWQNATWAQQLDVRIDTPRENGVSLSSGGPGVVIPSHCLVKPVDAHCELYTNIPICVVVIACNIIKLVCMYLAARVRHKEILLTIGDAIASFLDSPDATTKGKSGMSRSQCRAMSVQNLVGSSYDSQSTSPPPEHASPFGIISIVSLRRRRWYHAVGWRRWTVTIFL